MSGTGKNLPHDITGIILKITTNNCMMVMKDRTVAEDSVNVKMFLFILIFFYSFLNLCLVLIVWIQKKIHSF